MSALGPDSCALGPHATGKQDAQHLCNNASFASATIYYPTESGLKSLPSVVIVGGWGCGEQAMAAWAPFYASHGIVAMTIGTPSPFTDSPAVRSKALLDASLALQGEHERADSVLRGRLDISRRAVQGYSLGGGGAQLAALADPTLKCVIALATCFLRSTRFRFQVRRRPLCPFSFFVATTMRRRRPRSSDGRTTVRRALPS
mmetsp:Transcript_18151/g.58003  ORF Transcript_18151/g.58003 Transcript_18151/m.58003 type:complete len:202 (+) Transcript_18151:197-802(+)